MHLIFSHVLERVNSKVSGAHEISPTSPSWCFSSLETSCPGLPAHLPPGEGHWPWNLDGGVHPDSTPTWKPVLRNQHWGPLCPRLRASVGQIGHPSSHSQLSCTEAKVRQSHRVCRGVSLPRTGVALHTHSSEPCQVC
jgi:hypothetical protein